MQYSNTVLKRLIKGSVSPVERCYLINMHKNAAALDCDWLNSVNLKQQYKNLQQSDWWKKESDL
jgi:hypothetical protein